MRAFKPADLERCVRLFVDVFSQEPWEDHWPSLDRAQAYLSDIVNTPGFKGFVVYEGSEIVGLCFGHKVRWWAGDEFYVDEFCIASPVQRQGLGTRLMNHVKEGLLKEGIQYMVLLTDRETLAECFYLKQGFLAHPKTMFMYHRIDGG